MPLCPDGGGLLRERRPEGRHHLLLGHHLLSPVARIWSGRWRIELEARALFATLARDLRAAGVPGAIAAMAEQASRDEDDHAGRCARIVAANGGSVPSEAVAPAASRLGPASLDPGRRAIYAAAALSCVTETFSAALLTELHRVVTDPLVAETVHHILRDEIAHARLGWAVLAFEQRRRSLAWLGPHVPAMLRAAIAEDGAAVTAPDPAAPGVPSHGILSRARVDEILRAATRDVLVPGFAAVGVTIAE